MPERHLAHQSWPPIQSWPSISGDSVPCTPAGCTASRPPLHPVTKCQFQSSNTKCFIFHRGVQKHFFRILKRQATNSRCMIKVDRSAREADLWTACDRVSYTSLTRNWSNGLSKLLPVPTRAAPPPFRPVRAHPVISYIKIAEARVSKRSSETRPQRALVFAARRKTHVYASAA